MNRTKRLAATSVLAAPLSGSMAMIGLAGVWEQDGIPELFVKVGTCEADYDAVLDQFGLTMTDYRYLTDDSLIP